MAAQPVTQLPEGPEWLYELKLDGYRALLIKDGNNVQIRSRNNKDLTRMYPAVADAGQRLKADQAVVDGEIVALDSSGRPSFQALQHRGSYPGHQIVFYSFDVLHIDGRDVTGEPFEKRRKLLEEVVTPGAVLRISRDLSGTADEVVKAVRAAGLEGVIAKRKGSIYQPGDRSSDWLKLKLEHQQEFVVGGYRPDSASIDALLVGYYERKELRFAGKVRAGMVAHTRRELLQTLKSLQVTECPFVNLPDSDTGRRWSGGVTADQMQGMVWTRPKLVVQIRFVEWTAEGRLRHAAFLGVRADKAARDVHRE